MPRGTKAVRKYGRLIGGTLGAYAGPVGSLVGQRLGGYLANKAFRAFRSITGSGDYQVKSNTLARSNADQIPVFGQDGRVTRIRHREFICDIVSSSSTAPNNGGTNFLPNTFALNPGDMNTFPWLSQVASLYEEYKLHGCVFEFKSTSGDALNNTNSALGTVIMSTQYNVLNPPFANKQQMEDYEFATSCKPSLSMIHPIECDPHETPSPEMYIRTASSVVVGSDLRLYDHAQFCIATVGLQQANMSCGELWVSYDVELLKPRLPILTDQSWAFHASGTGATAANPLNGFQTQTSSTMRCTLTSGGSIQLPQAFQGVFIMIYTITGTAPVSGGMSAPTWIPYSSGSNLQANNIYSGDTTNQFFFPNNGVNTTQYCYLGSWSTIRNSNAAFPNILFNQTQLSNPPTNNTWDLFIIPAPGITN